ncbi:HAMP domain-containing histidine kinase [Winogradskyella sp.]|nr:HAMP domain-containing histidine kinase [Winogradskyella sp.]MDC0007011.1 HAMP domain-containing histidine kinase [Winogradskyella sp.]MDC0009333.1 HAMP domain-containing histidine kinase [Winogradskyella sp.]MDC1503889.1 HAMP domain-containing histidine kinase [Winogradskyella sp.]
MTLSAHRNLIRWIIITSSFIIISLILWNTYVFFQNFKDEERSKMKNWTFAYPEYSKYFYQDNAEMNFVADRVVTDTTVSTPMLLLDANNKILSFRNIDTLLIENPKAVVSMLNKLIAQNEPLDVRLPNDKSGKLYYGNSPLLNKLKYYPLALLLIIILFSAVVYFFYRSSKIADQNKLWTGMAKETAHQIGTPLSSLIGWTEILKIENVNPEYILEIEKDVDRLQTITERFSKIGSKPTLVKTDIIKATKNSYDYLKSRSSKLINFEIILPETELFVDLNEQLFSWTIENLVKNAIDAMRGKGDLQVEISKTDKLVLINVSDTGKGLAKNQFNTIFEPGFTTKKRGWGLGLSLAKRIIEDYHNGKIKVLNSDIGKGTTLQISLKIVD